VKYFILNVSSTILWLVILSFTDAPPKMGSVLIIYLMTAAIPHAIVTGILGTLWDKYGFEKWDF
jgi:hypothetical protein